MTQRVANDSKARILNAFQKILAEQQTLKSKLVPQTKPQTAKKQPMEPIAQNSEDSILQSLADLQLEFSCVIDALSVKLITENQRLSELRGITQQALVRSHNPQHDRILSDTLKQSYELQIQSLEAKIIKQTEQIAEVSTQLALAMQHAQELAIRALEHSAR